jgi:hypothetical protein
MKMVKLQRGQISRKFSHINALDITVKSSTGFGRMFTPTWRMVMDHKRGKMLDQEYRLLYFDILRAVPEETWRQLQQYGEDGKGTITFTCFCPDGAFCHTYQLIEFAVRHYPERFNQ